MSEPSREHIDAVARFLNDDLGCDNFYNGVDVLRVRRQARGEARADAEALLTSTDPAILDAMQDALVRAGRLRETGQQRFHVPHVGLQVRDCYVTDWREPDDE